MTRVPAAEQTEVTLPYGRWRGNEVARSVYVRGLEGRDEEAFEAALTLGRTPLDAGNALLTRCVSLAGEPIDAAALVLGDREILLREIYAETVAPSFEALVDCECGAAVQLEVDLRALAVPAPEPGPVHLVDIGAARLNVRLPCAGDLAVAMMSTDPPAALLRRCADAEDHDEILADAIAWLDPNAECAIVLECPDCAASTTAYLDATDLLRRTLSERGDLLAQVDLLARTYGWSESDILSLPRRRRQRYLDLAAA